MLNLIDAIFSLAILMTFVFLALFIIIFPFIMIYICYRAIKDPHHFTRGPAAIQQPPYIRTITRGDEINQQNQLLSVLLQAEDYKQRYKGDNNERN